MLDEQCSFTSFRVNISRRERWFCVQSLYCARLFSCRFDVTEASCYRMLQPHSCNSKDVAASAGQILFNGSTDSSILRENEYNRHPNALRMSVPTYAKRVARWAHCYIEHALFPVC